MSNYDLQSKLNQLQGELRQAERVNAELRGELSTVEPVSYTHLAHSKNLLDIPTSRMN